MDILHILAFLVFFVGPAVAVAVGLFFLEDRDSTDGIGWRGGDRDPFRQIAYGKDGKIRRHFRSVAGIILLLYLIAVAWIALYEFGRR